MKNKILVQSKIVVLTLIRLLREASLRHIQQELAEKMKINVLTLEKLEVVYLKSLFKPRVLFAFYVKYY